MKRRLDQQSGFTLMELMIVVLILSLLVWPFLEGVQRVRFEAKRELSASRLNAAKQVLLNFVRVNAFLPCPDGSRDGFEDRDGSGRCKYASGHLPYREVLVSPLQLKDAWGNEFIYAIDASALDGGLIQNSGSSAAYFARDGAPRFSLRTPPNALLEAENGFIICRANGGDCDDSRAELHSISAVVMAANKRGIGSSFSSCSSSTLWEKENCDGDRYLVSGGYVKDLFDDQLVVISAYEIKAQLLSVWGL
ncbi:type II secretion system protein [Thiomicrorhabdus sp.]|uniref:type II secretion system protein n=1 Tax=Thiomicrorhabdus sp. TaxID=2039724 RepID=UPI0029C78F27|nr:type II secretion system protein [Thiomicrorhabdus sp.]